VADGLIEGEPEALVEAGTKGRVAERGPRVTGTSSVILGVWAQVADKGPAGPEGFYRKLGFQLTGENSEGQTVGVLDLTNA
jgi:hypothetical protein